MEVERKLCGSGSKLTRNGVQVARKLTKNVEIVTEVNL